MNPKLIGLARHFSGLTQSELAEKLGVSQYAVSKFESGLLKPSPEALRKMTAIFEINGIGTEELKFFTEIISKD